MSTIKITRNLPGGVASSASVNAIKGDVGPQGPPGTINAIELSAAEYAALPTPRPPNMFYIVT
jgi:hypothetical protein